MTTENQIHDKYKDEIKDFFNSKGIHCVDFEAKTSGMPGKKPDLELDKNNVLVEIKIMFLNENLKNENEQVVDSLNNEKTTTYWMTETPNFRSHLVSCQKKFADHENNKTMVIFVNRMAHQEQTIEELMTGEESFQIQPSNPPKIVDHYYKNREIRQDKNNRIGVLAQYYPEDKKLIIIHNPYADTERKIDINTFKNIKDIKQKIYNYAPEEDYHFIDIE